MATHTQKPPGNHFQHPLLQAFVSWNETAVQGLAEVGKTQNALHVALTEEAGVNRLLDTLAAQQAALMQLAFDAQLSLFQTLMGGVEQAEPAALPMENGAALLGAWGQAQDEWLKFTQGVIDTAKSPPTDQ